MKILQLTTSNLKTLIAAWILSIGIAIYATISIDNKYITKAINKRDIEIAQLGDSIIVQKTVNKLLRQERLSEKTSNENTKKGRIILQKEYKNEQDREKFLLDSINSLSISDKELLFARILAGEEITK